MFEYRAIVLSVHDGDTLDLDVDLGFRIHNIQMVMRLAGVDAPELKRADRLGELAREALTGWLAAHPGPYTAHTEKDHTEKYGRYLLSALVAADSHELINDQMAAGYLKFYTGNGPKPTWP
jgi:micrococcal nuclease